MLIPHNRFFQTSHHHATYVVRKLNTTPIRVLPTVHARTRFRQAVQARHRAI